MYPVDTDCEVRRDLVELQMALVAETTRQSSDAIAV